MRTETQLVVGTRGDNSLAHVRPIDLSTTYRTPDPSAAINSMEAFAAGAAEAANPIYARLSNPNGREFEDRMTRVEDGADSVCFASGMAAISALLLEAQTRGDHIVAVPPLYGGSHHLLSSGLLNTRVTWAAAHDVGDAIQPDTALVLAETPSNPTLTLTNIERLVDDARGVPVAIDSTFATPILQKPLRHGAAYSLHSATKFIGGHGDAMGGVITTGDSAAAARLRQIRTATGAILHPIAAHLFCRGLQTLALRVRAQQENAQRLVELLQQHPEVRAVRYPGLQSADEPILAEQMAGPGSMVAIQLEGGPERADAFITCLRLLVPAVSLGAVDTLVQRPASLTHQILSAHERDFAGIPEDLVRISVGAEHVEDLWEDVRSAIESSKPNPERIGSSAALLDVCRR
jgi:methionine-gamma-lyase